MRDARGIAATGGFTGRCGYAGAGFSFVTGGRAGILDGHPRIAGVGGDPMFIAEGEETGARCAQE